MTSSPTPSRVFAALRRHGLALLVPCSILAITFGGYRDNLQKEEASRLLLFQAQARVQVNHLRERAGSLLQLAEKLHTLRPESTGKRPDGLGPVLAQHPEILRVGVLRRGPGGSLITDSAEPARQAPCQPRRQPARRPPGAGRQTPAQRALCPSG
jgi:hypothetical protein